MRPVRIIVPFPAGQATDTIARLMGQSLSDPGVACSSLLLLKTTEHRRRRVAAPLTCRWIAMREHRRFGQAGCCARAAPAAAYHLRLGAAGILCPILLRGRRT